MLASPRNKPSRSKIRIAGQRVSEEIKHQRLNSFHLQIFTDEIPVLFRFIIPFTPWNRVCFSSYRLRSVQKRQPIIFYFRDANNWIFGVSVFLFKLNPSARNIRLLNLSSLAISRYQGSTAEIFVTRNSLNHHVKEPTCFF